MVRKGQVRPLADGSHAERFRALAALGQRRGSHGVRGQAVGQSPAERGADCLKR